MLSATPVAAAEFAAALDPIAAGDGAVAIAVSGGPDSTALALLARDWARPRGIALLALTVDHGLRAESAAEAALVARRMAGLGIDHRTLVWADAAPGAAHAAARAARYRLLLDACRAAGCDRLLLGHTRDDQAETLLWRLARGSGPDGLAGMAPLRVERGVRLLRPLLDLPKARLIATCDIAGVDFVTDPSNRAPRHARGRLRATRAALAAEGMTDEHLARFATRMAAMRDALDRAAARLLGEAATVSPFGFVRLARPVLAAADPEIARRALARVLRLVGGREHEPAFEAVTAALGRVCGGLPATLGGCVLRGTVETVSVFREARGLVPRALATGERTLLWDRRFEIDLPRELPEGASIAPWGAASAGSAAAHGVPNAAARTLPALWCGTRIVRTPLRERGAAAPVLDWRFVGIGPAPFSYGVASETSAIMYSGERAQCSVRGRPGTPDEVKGRGP